MDWFEEISVDDEVSESVDDGGEELSAVDVIVSKVVTATVTVCTDEVLMSIGSELDDATESVVGGRAPDSDVVELPVSSVEVGPDELSDSELDACAELAISVSVPEAELEKKVELAAVSVGGGVSEELSDEDSDG